MAVSKKQIPLKGFEAILINQTVSISANSSLDIDVTPYLPSGKTAFYACGALARYQLPWIPSDTGEVRTYIKTVFQNVVTIKNPWDTDWTNAPMNLIVFYN